VEPSPSQILAQGVPGSEIPDWSQVDAVEAVTLDGIEHGDRVGDVRIDADGDFKSAERDRRTGDGD
jgi:hypothetical protein